MYGSGNTVILVVEDDPLLRLLGVDLIEEAGFTAVEARDADEAIRILEQRKDISIVVTDIEMPGSMDGLKLAHAVRDRWPPVHLILVSGRAAPGASLMPDGSRFFAKPFKSEELLATIRTMAQAPRAAG